MRILSTIIFVMFLGLLTSCENSDSPSNPAVNPFSNGGTERNMIVVISDIHLGADLAYTETKKNISNLDKFLEQIRVAPNIKELIIAGDMFDEWFVPATINTYNGKDQKDFMQRIATTNKSTIDLFNKIITENNIIVTYVPGNHDLTITADNVNSILPGIKQSRDNKLGLGTYSPATFPELAVEHGHRYNFFCAPDPYSNKDIAPGSILPPGYFFTRIGALHISQDCHKSGDSLLTVTENTTGGESQTFAYKYWKSWQWSVNYLPITNKFNEKIIVTNINGFTETYSLNDLLPFQSTPGGFIDMKLFKGIQDNWEARQTDNNVAVHIPTAHAIDSVSSISETDNQAKLQYFNNSGSNKRIVVFGHTHHATIIASNNNDGKKCVYANSGTWIDTNTQGPTTMNFVVITPQSAATTSQTYIKLYNFQGGVTNNMSVDSLRY